MTNSRGSVAVIGAGITGLTAACRLQQLGHDVTVFEAAPRPGGVIRSERADGWLVEHGPNSLNAPEPAVQAFLAELGLESVRVDAAPLARKRFIVRDGRPAALPTSPLGLLRTPVLSLRGKFRLLLEPFIPRAAAGVDESLADFVRRRLGNEALDYLVNPFVAGIYAGDPEQLDVHEAMPRLAAFEREHGSLFRGGLHAMRARHGAGIRRGGISSFADGMESLPAALAGRLGNRLRLATPVAGAERVRTGWRLALERHGGESSGPFDAVLCAAPAHRVAELRLQLPDREPLRVLADLPYAPVTVVALGFRRQDVRHPLDGFGMLVPAVEGSQILGTLFSSSLFPGRAPDGHVLLTTFVGGARAPAVAKADDDMVLALVQRDLGHLLGVHAGPVFQRVIRWTHAIPQYTRQHAACRAALDALEAANPGLYLAGNYRGGISLGDTMRSSLEAAGRIAEALVSRAATGSPDPE